MPTFLNATISYFLLFLNNTEVDSYSTHSYFNVLSLSIISMRFTYVTAFIRIQVFLIANNILFFDIP